LDELYLIDNALETQQMLAKQKVFAEGNWGCHLFLIASGTISLVKEIDGKEQELEQFQLGNFLVRLLYLMMPHDAMARSL